MSQKHAAVELAEIAVYLTQIRGEYRSLTTAIDQTTEYVRGEAREHRRDPDQADLGDLADYRAAAERCIQIVEDLEDAHAELFEHARAVRK